MATATVATKPFELSALDREILELVASRPGITLPATCDRLFPTWSPQWVRERVRRLGLVGTIRIEGNHTSRLYLARAEVCAT